MWLQNKSPQQRPPSLAKEGSLRLSLLAHVAARGRTTPAGAGAPMLGALYGAAEFVTSPERVPQGAEGTRVRVGVPTDIPPGTVRFVPVPGALVVHGKDGCFAMPAVLSASGGVVRTDMTLPRRRSMSMTGVAPMPLRRYPLLLVDGVIYLELRLQAAGYPALKLP